MSRLPRTPFVLLGLLTVLTVGGPIAIASTLRGGASPRWPPDRPVEWWTFGAITGSVIVLMSACLTIGLINWRRTVSTTTTGRGSLEEPSRSDRPLP